jgi:hypothetical protein
MTSTPELRVRLRLKEALERVNEARCAAADSWTATRLQIIERDLEDTLMLLTPDQIAWRAEAGKSAVPRRRH